MTRRDLLAAVCCYALTAALPLMYIAAAHYWGVVP